MWTCFHFQYMECSATGIFHFDKWLLNRIPIASKNNNNHDDKNDDKNDDYGEEKKTAST